MATASSIHFRWKLSPKQRELFESDARYRIGMMGRRFGKNEVATAALIEYATQPEKYDFGSDSNPTCWWMGPTYRQSYRYGYLKVLEKLPDRVITDHRGSEHGTCLIELVDGTEIEFLSYTNPEGVQGAGVDLVVGDEWAYAPEERWNADLRPMLLDSGGGAVFISKPLGENHFNEFFERGQSPEYPDWFSVHATSYENPFIEDSEIDKARSETPEPVFRQQYLADPQAGGALLTRDMLQFVHADDIPDRELSWRVVADLGHEADPKKARDNDTDYWAAGIVAYDGITQQAYYVDVTRTRGMTKDQGVGWLASIMEGVPTNKVGVESNQAQVWFLQDAQKHGLNAYGIENDRPKEERIMYLSVPFANGNVKLVNHDDPNERDAGQEFDPRWNEFVKEWLSFPAGKHDDMLDVTEMCLRNLNLGTDITAYGGHAYGDV